MILPVQRFANKILTVLLALSLLPVSLESQQEDYTFRVQSELVLVNVTVRDKNGNLVGDLKPGDFTILEDNRPQKVVSFDVENMDAVATQDLAQTKALPSSPSATAPGASPANGANQFKDRRL